MSDSAQPSVETEVPKAAGGSKFDASLLPQSDDPAEIRKQVEFYFSDSNLPFDKFLYGLVTKENKPVPVKLVSSFKRMRRFPDHEKIVAALRDSEILEVAGDGGEETIKRRVPLPIGQAATKPEEGVKPNLIHDRTLDRSMYAKGFGEEGPTTQVDIEKLLEPFGPINAVRLRRDDKRNFKGSIFVEFANVETFQKFAALPNEEKPKWNDQPLEWETKESYVNRKAEDIAAGRLKPNTTRPKNKFNAFKEEREREQKQGGERGRGQRGGRGGRGGRGRGGRGRGRGRGGRGGNNGGDRNEERRENEAGESATSNGVKRKADDAAPGPEGDAKKAKADE